MKQVMPVIDYWRERIEDHPLHTWLVTPEENVAARAETLVRAVFHQFHHVLPRAEPVSHLLRRGPQARPAARGDLRARGRGHDPLAAVHAGPAHPRLGRPARLAPVGALLLAVPQRGQRVAAPPGHPDHQAGDRGGGPGGPLRRRRVDRGLRERAVPAHRQGGPRVRRGHRQGPHLLGSLPPRPRDRPRRRRRRVRGGRADRGAARGGPAPGDPHLRADRRAEQRHAAPRAGDDLPGRLRLPPRHPRGTREVAADDPRARGVRLQLLAGQRRAPEPASGPGDLAAVPARRCATPST